jgi:hypothetical protein
MKRVLAVLAAALVIGSGSVAVSLNCVEGCRESDVELLIYTGSGKCDRFKGYWCLECTPTQPCIAINHGGDCALLPGSNSDVEKWECNECSAACTIAGTWDVEGISADQCSDTNKRFPRKHCTDPGTP